MLTKRPRVVTTPTHPSGLAPIETPRDGDGDPTAETPRDSLAPARKDNTFEKWTDVQDRFLLERILGSGSYGEVASAVDRTSGTRVAIKRIHHLFDVELDTKRIVREIQILRHLKHENIVELIEVIAPTNLATFNELYLVFEYVETDLHKLISTPQYLTVEHIKYLLYQLLCALKYMHSASVIHRDIKPANILVNEDCKLKVCDFGLARVLRNSRQAESETASTTTTTSAASPARPSATPPAKQILTRQLTKHVVTRWYRPPELILLQEYTCLVDVWSVGCIFAELLSMQKESVPAFQERQPLFPGRSCFPLSADNDRTYKDQVGGKQPQQQHSRPSSFRLHCPPWMKTYKCPGWTRCGGTPNSPSQADQLNVIFDVIGTPMEEDLANLGSVQVYLRGLPRKAPKDFAVMFPAAPPEAIDLLTKMLVFNPDRRISVAEALAHPFLESTRQEDKELVAAAGTVTLDEGMLAKLSSEGLKKYLLEEIHFYRKKKAE